MPQLSVRKRILKQRRIRWMLVALFVLSLILGLIIVPIEHQAGGNITTPLDGIWWAISTVTTVGYGDFVPITAAGKVIGILLMLLGATMFGILVAVMSSFISRSQDEFYWNRLFERIDRLEHEIDELKKRTGYMVKNE